MQSDPTASAKSAPIHPPAFEPIYPWDDLAARPSKTAIYVVHGMGSQSSQGTSAAFRTQLDAVLAELKAEGLPLPYIHEGYWANYDDLAAFLPKQWERLSADERDFYAEMWQGRAHALAPTVGWFLGKAFSLFGNKIKAGLKTRLLYVGTAIVFPFVLLLLALRYRTLVTEVLADVRLYCAPKSSVERAMVAAIDEKVETEFLRLIGLNRELQTLPEADHVQLGGRAMTFDRVIWVAHSLGTVVSYNAVSRLGQRARASGPQGQPVFQKLTRFITIGSPLDKIAHFEPSALAGSIPNEFWADATVSATQAQPPRNWWVNFFNHLDPVSGSLDGAYLGQSLPTNVHVSWGWNLNSIPGAAHIAYWKDHAVLRYVLSRLHGQQVVKAKTELARDSRAAAAVRGMTACMVWGVIILTLAALFAGAGAYVCAADKFAWLKLGIGLMAGIALGLTGALLAANGLMRYVFSPKK
jgi:pimeloyl-ACP methyl ester carboxylesterase